MMTLKGAIELQKAIARSPEIVKDEAQKFFVRANREILQVTNRTPWRVGASGGGVPVDTGNLRDKVHTTTFEQFKMTIKVDERNVKYAGFVHEGTGRMEGRPWLDYAKDQSEDPIDRLMEQMLVDITNNLAK